MPERPQPADAPRNRLLAKLPRAEYRRLLPHLEPVDLECDDTLYEARGPVDHAYFPTGAVLSALTVMRDGNTIEVATVGREGLMGHFGPGGTTSVHKVIAQVDGQALRIASRDLHAAAVAGGTLKGLLAAYHVAFLAQLFQSVACNGLQGLQQRCCRWLLMSRDRAGSDDIRLTHESLAKMLGARRTSVTEVLRPLQDEGLVRCERGRISILDGAGLEACSCECYFVLRDQYRRLLGEAA